MLKELVVGSNSWIKLPKMYARAELSVDKEEISTPDKIKQWDYLKLITSDITQTDGIKVGLLIGANCMKALEPLKVISSVDGGPCTYQTRIGWCILGPIIKWLVKYSLVVTKLQ